MWFIFLRIFFAMKFHWFDIAVESIHLTKSMNGTILFACIGSNTQKRKKSLEFCSEVMNVFIPHYIFHPINYLLKRNKKPTEKRETIRERSFNSLQGNRRIINIYLYMHCLHIFSPKIITTKEERNDWRLQEIGRCSRVRAD